MKKYTKFYQHEEKICKLLIEKYKDMLENPDFEQN